ncbi:hypothetical protein EDC04DRAFT_2605606 [Pisolithus marmoratus]|nr:hypothetical protein EDC04DRAFT_2605606 [Pisolithus marmoratus]
MPSASSALDTNTTANAVGDSDIVMQDFAGPSPPNPKTGTTPIPSATATSTPNANTATTNPNVTTNPNTGIRAHLTSIMTHIRPGPSAGMCSHPSLTLSTSSHSIWSLTGPSATVSGMLGVGHSASSVSTPGNAKVNGNGTNGGASGSVKAACSNCDHRCPYAKTTWSSQVERHSNTSTTHISTHPSTSLNVHHVHSSTSAGSGDNTREVAHGIGYTTACGGHSKGGGG